MGPFCLGLNVLIGFVHIGFGNVLLVDGTKPLYE